MYLLLRLHLLRPLIVIFYVKIFIVQKKNQEKLPLPWC